MRTTTIVMMTLAGITGAMSGAASAGSAPQPGLVLDQAGDALLPFYEDDFAHDLASVDAVFDLTSDTLVVDVRFHTDLSTSPHIGEVPDLIAFVSFDLDNDAGTGYFPEQNGHEFFQTLPVGAEMDVGVVPFGRGASAGGSVDGQDFFGGVEYAPDRVLLTYDLSVLRSLGVEAGEYNFATFVGTTSQPTDALDVVGRSRVVVPAPGAGVLAVVGGLLAARRRRG